MFSEQVHRSVVDSEGKTRENLPLFDTDYHYLPQCGKLKEVAGFPNARIDFC
jgi:hypothetical protein